MKEIIPNDLPGRSEQNTFLNYDIFEARKGVAPLSVRSAYDLSDPYVLGDYTFGGFTSSIRKYWDNKIFDDSGYPSASGAGGDLVPYFYNKGLITRETYESDYPKTLTFDQKGFVPEFNEDAMLSLSSYSRNSYQNAGSSKIKTERSGYYEFTFKTNKQNSIIAYGNSDLFQTLMPEGVTAELNASATVLAKEPVVISSDYAYIQEENVTNKTFSINLKNGKVNLKYKDNLINHEDDFEITGNLNVADDKWHHVVVNIGRPGTLRERGLKFNKKFIEIWVDGELDFRTTDYINNKNIFFPILEWMLMNPLLAISYDGVIENGWNTGDRNKKDAVINGVITFDDFDTTIGINEIPSVIIRGTYSDAARTNAFKGSFHTVVYGVNYCLNKFEIQQRLRLWRGYEKQLATVYNVNAEMVNPTVNANKKKALKLFWNNLINDKAKDGIELDNNFVVDSYSVTHKIKNSKTEVNNIDVANSKSITVLEDVRAAITSNLILWGPGVDTYYNDSTVTGILNREINVLPEVRQYNPLDLNDEPAYDEYDYIDSIYNPEYNPTGTNKFTTYAYNNLLIGGVKLENSDRILLTNQFSKRDNGIYVFNGLNKPLTRAVNASSPFQINNGVVRVTDGQFKDTSWTLESDIDSLLDDQKWIQLEYNPNSDNINTQPIFTNRWTNEKGIERFIDLQQDININSYDLIVFMNYPETSEEIKESLVGYSDFEVKIMYDNFIKSLRNVCAQGASLYVSSPKLAIDLGVVKKFTGVSQMTEEFDSQSALITPFEVNETADKYFDTHRNNKYNVATEVAGLTNKETYILTDFINYNVGNTYDYEQYHAKYAYRQLGLKEGNEFFIPGLALREVTENTNLPGFGLNRKGLKDLMVVDPIDIVVGTTVTKLANNVYQGSSLVANQYDDYATTIIVHNNQVLNGQPITGKIFINCVEDGYTFSRQDYNKAVIQVLPTPDVNETTATRAWQYSTTRLNRSPQKINIRELTEFGQTTPTNGGGGPLIQSPTNSSSGIIRSGSDKDNANYQSDLYPKQEEEIYTLQEIPVLSMTYLGLQWLAE
jgi:hypothetical protein